MLRRIFILAFLFLFGRTILTGQQINFRQISMQEAFEAAKNENKLIFLHGFADWCSHCQNMAQHVYTDSAVAGFFNTHFVCIKMDMEKEGKEIASQLKIHSFPNFIFLNANQEAVHRSAGEKSKAEILVMGTTAMDTTRNLWHYIQLFKNNTASRDESYQYMVMQRDARMDNSAILHTYLLRQGPDHLLTPGNWRFIYDFLQTSDVPVMSLLVQNRKGFEVFAHDSVEHKILIMYLGDMMKKIQQRDTIAFENMKQQLRATGLEYAEKICAYADLSIYFMIQNWDGYIKNAALFIENYAGNDYRRLNDIAYTFYQHTDDAAYLAKAETWARKAVKLMDSYKNNNTLANILSKENKKPEALSIINHAIELAKKSGQDYNQALTLRHSLELENK